MGNEAKRPFTWPEHWQVQLVWKVAKCYHAKTALSLITATNFGGFRSRGVSTQSMDYVMDVEAALRIALKGRVDLKELLGAWKKLGYRDEITEIDSFEAELIRLVARTFDQRGLKPGRYFAKPKKPISSKPRRAA